MSCWLEEFTGEESLLYTDTHTHVVPGNKELLYGVARYGGPSFFGSTQSRCSIGVEMSGDGSRHVVLHYTGRDKRMRGLSTVESTTMEGTERGVRCGERERA